MEDSFRDLIAIGLKIHESYQNKILDVLDADVLDIDELSGYVILALVTYFSSMICSMFLYYILKRIFCCNCLCCKRDYTKRMKNSYPNKIIKSIFFINNIII